jgi:hypothetical protein
MRLMRTILAGLVLALILALVSPGVASGVVCHDYPAGCCEDVKILGKTVLHIDC